MRGSFERTNASPLEYFGLNSSLLMRLQRLHVMLCASLVFYPQIDKGIFYTFILSGLLTVTVVLFKYRLTLKIDLLSIGLLLVLLFELINYSQSIYPQNTLIYFIKIAAMVVFYFLLKFSFAGHTLNRLCGLMAVLGFIIGLSTLFYFKSFSREWGILGIKELTDFKNSYFPLRMNSNEAATVFLCSLSFPSYFLIMSKKYILKIMSALCIILLVFAILTTFSRGAYIALFLWILMILLMFYLLKIYSRNLLGILFICISLAFLLCASIIGQPFKTTLAINQTTSQRLSTEGRTYLLKSGFRIFKDYPLFGIGSYNFPLKYASTPKPELTKFNSNITNTYLLLLIEKGIIGFIIYAVIILFIIIFAFRSIIATKKQSDKAIQVIFLSTLIALLIREIFYASIFINDIILLLLMMHIYIVVSFSSLHFSFIIFQKEVRFSGIMMLLGLAITLLNMSFKFFLAGLAYKKSVSAYHTQDYISSLVYIQKAITFNNNNAHYLSYCGLASLNVLQTRISINWMNKFHHSLERPDEQINHALRYFLLANSLNERASYLHNIGWLYFLQKNPERAFAYFKRSVSIDPHVAIYHINLGMMYEKYKSDSLAVAEYTQAIKLSPDILESKFYSTLKSRAPTMAFIALKTARGYLEDDIKKNSTTKSKARLAKLYIETGDSIRALTLLNAVISDLPNMNRPYLYRADLYYKSNRRTQALRDLIMAEKLDRMDYFATYKLSNYYNLINDTIRSKAYLRMTKVKRARAFSEESLKSSKIYYLPIILPDELIPQDLLNYIKPSSPTNVD